MLLFLSIVSFFHFSFFIKRTFSILLLLRQSTHTYWTHTVILRCQPLIIFFSHCFRSIMKFICAKFLMTRSCCNFNNTWRGWRWWWNFHIFNCANMILDFNKRFLWILKTTLCPGHRLHIQTCFHFDRNIWMERKKKKICMEN